MSAPAVITVPDVGADESADHRPSTVRRWAWRIVPPVIAYLLNNLLYGIAAVTVFERYFTVGSRVRADSGLYSAIAHHGYELFRCREDPTLAPMFTAEAWCGTTGWFPAYPWLIRIVSFSTGHVLREYESGLLISELACLASMFMAWRLVRRAGGLGEPQTAGPWRLVARRHARPFAVLALMIGLPSGVYLHAVFPMSFAAALAAGVALLTWHRRWVLAGLAGAVIAMTYPIGVVIAAIGFGAVLTGWRRGELAARRALGALALTVGGPVLGLLSVFGVHHLAVGRWNGYLLIQEHYGNGINDPFTSFFRLISEPAPIPIAEPRRDMIGELNLMTDAELLLTLLLVMTLVVACLLAARRGSLHSVDVGLTLYAAAVFLAPLVAGASVSQYRSHVLLVPALVVLRHIRARYLAPAALVSVVVAYVMGQLFFLWLLF
jgi:hypothetical protein